MCCWVCQSFCVYEEADLFQKPSGQTSYILQKHLIIFFEKWLRHFRAKISLFGNGAWSLGLGLIYSGRHTALLCSVLTSRYVHSATQKLLLCFWKCHPKHTVLWKLCSVEGWSGISECKLAKSRQTGEGLPAWRGKWSGATSSLIIRSNKLSTETVLKLSEARCYSHSAHRRGWGFSFGPKVMGIAMKQELSITVRWPVFYRADVTIRLSLWKKWWWLTWGDHGLFLAMCWISCTQGTC